MRCGGGAFHRLVAVNPSGLGSAIGSINPDDGSSRFVDRCGRFLADALSDDAMKRCRIRVGIGECFVPPWF